MQQFDYRLTQDDCARLDGLKGKELTSITGGFRQLPGTMSYTTWNKLRLNCAEETVEVNLGLKAICLQGDEYDEVGEFSITDANPEKPFMIEATQEEGSEIILGKLIEDVGLVQNDGKFLDNGTVVSERLFTQAIIIYFSDNSSLVIDSCTTYSEEMLVTMANDPQTALTDQTDEFTFEEDESDGGRYTGELETKIILL